MNKLILGFLGCTMMLSVMGTTHAQSFRDIFKRSQQNKNASSAGELSNNEVVQGLKEALKVGSQNATKQLSVTDGFFKNQAIKILLPPEVQQVERTLRSVGMGSLVDEAILKMNRAAEDAAQKATPIFVNAITGITIQDGFSILRGGNDAATQYLKRSTTAQLTNAFRPVIQSSLSKVGADRIWTTVFETYNRLPLATNKINPDLTGYVTEQALVGLFTTIADEELKIRTNPGAQVTNILKRVFGQ